MKKNIYNIAATKDFHAFLAEKYANEFIDNPLGLSDVLFLVPSRRAVGSLRNAFLQVFNLRPMILPQIKAVSDFDEDELLLKIDDFANVMPAIDKDERLFNFIKLIMTKNNVNLPQAYYLSIELASFLDEANNLGVDLANLENIVADDYAEHVKDMLSFLRIITKSWPNILCEYGKIDASERQSQILALAAKNMNNSKQKIVVAGVSAPFVCIKEFLRTLDNADIYFYGVDMVLPAPDWDVINETHPSFENKMMMEHLGVKRSDMINVFEPSKKEEFVSELMRPAITSEKWQNINQDLITCFNDFNVIEAENMAQEALIIALIIKKHLDENKDVALVSPDRGLSRRVCAELKRFDIEVDDTAGRPLSSTPLGAFMRLILLNVINDCDVVSFLSLIKHPYFADKSFVKEYEKKVLRKKQKDEELSMMANAIKDKLVLPQRASLKEMMSEHIKLCQAFCEKLFVKEEGRVATQLFSEILEKSELIDAIDVAEYQEYFESVLSGAMVRNTYAAHPKVKILGPIEARFNKYDVTIIGACVEGVWPLAANANPWLSESMKKQLGLKTHSYNVGIYSFDFAASLLSKKVYVTHSLKSGGAPQVKSRFLLKLEALGKLLGYKDEKKEEWIYKKVAQIINQPTNNINIEPPAPKPPLYARPQEISASQIEVLIKDPYQIFAKKILGLYMLDDLKQEPDIKDYGTIIHKILEIFYKKYPTVFPQNAKEELLAIGQEVFEQNKLSQELLIFWQEKLNKIVDWLVEVENKYCVDVSKRYSEISASINLANFVVKAKADRIDVLTNGQINIVDYKTGQIKSKSQIYSGYAPQLPAEGIIFEDHLKTDVANLIYWQLGKKQALYNDNLEELFLKAKEQLLALISAYGDEDMPYHSYVDANNMPKFSDYEHLSRFKEWAVKGDLDE